MRKRFDEHGRELVSSQPVAVPSGFKRPETLAEQVQRLVRRFSEEQAEQLGFETLEESDDFDVEDDQPDPSTPYETVFDPILGREVTPAMVHQQQEAYRAEARVKAARSLQERDQEEERQEIIRSRPRRQVPRKRPVGTPKTPPAEEPGDED